MVTNMTTDFALIGSGNVTRSVHCTAGKATCDPVIILITNVINYRTFYTQVPSYGPNLVLAWASASLSVCITLQWQVSIVSQPQLFGGFSVDGVKFAFNFRNSQFAQFELGFRVRV